ncbi:MAG TPA: hypothetical protein VLA61_21160 [Ideonella sp.]|uniref:hypothetical protein n=1 Tax=Ideonella sp. TaxID=1929293 RepID=UPI002BE66299|nr:hypothetical protein [Ideonella sp.]HSI50786.1 hypothetical protein [Ideonella sp.]
MKKWIAAAALALAAGWVGAIEPDVATPMACPQCGEWRVTYASREGAVGAVLSIDETVIKVPSCGSFAYRSAVPVFSLDPRGQGRYQLVTDVTPMDEQMGACSMGKAPFRMSLYLVNRFNAEAGVAGLELRSAGDEVPLLSLSAWNLQRDDPCGSGGSEGQAACLILRNTEVYAELAKEAYGSALEAKTGAQRNALRMFNPALFAAETMKACRKREAQSGGFDWPEANAQACQLDQLVSKLAELRAWQACLAPGMKPKGQCKLPTDKVRSLVKAS